MQEGYTSSSFLNKSEERHNVTSSSSPTAITDPSFESANAVQFSRRFASAWSCKEQSEELPAQTYLYAYTTNENMYMVLLLLCWEVYTTFLKGLYKTQEWASICIVGWSMTHNEEQLWTNRIRMKSIKIPWFWFQKWGRFMLVRRIWRPTYTFWTGIQLFVASRERMFVSHSKVVSLLLAIMTMITWGTNKIAVKYLTYPVSLYTIDFFVWVFIFHTILSLTLGARWFPGDDKDAFQNILDIVKRGVRLSIMLHF